MPKIDATTFADAEPKTLDTDAPLHAFEVSVKIGGNTWEYVLQTLTELAEYLRDNGPRGLASGGWNGCHSIDIRQRDISPEAYRAELEAWREARYNAAHGHTQDPTEH